LSDQKGEANLPRASVANVSQLATVDKSALVESIGTLSRARMHQILEGIALLLVPTE
jgi:mRNA interferase MazF